MIRMLTILVAGTVACAQAQAEPVARHPAAKADSSPAELRQAVLASLQDRDPEGAPPHGDYAIARIGTTDHYVVYIRTPGSCGSGGCVPHIWTKEGTTYRPKQSLTVSHLPIVQLPQSDHGMPRLGISVFNKNRVSMMITPVRFDGAQYTATLRELRGNAGRPLITEDMLTAF